MSGISHFVKPLFVVISILISSFCNGKFCLTVVFRSLAPLWFTSFTISEIQTSETSWGRAYWWDHCGKSLCSLIEVICTPSLFHTAIFCYFIVKCYPISLPRWSLYKCVLHISFEQCIDRMWSFLSTSRKHLSQDNPALKLMNVFFHQGKSLKITQYINGFWNWISFSVKVVLSAISFLLRISSFLASL